jgi:hypothetical protein
MDVDLDGFESLLAAVRTGDAIPGRGRIHLEAMARLAPRLAAERLARGKDPGPFLAGGEETLRRAGETLDAMRLDPEDAISAALRLRGGLRLVRGVADALASRPPRTGDARALLDTYVRAVGDDPVARALRPLLP